MDTITCRQIQRTHIRQWANLNKPLPVIGKAMNRQHNSENIH